MAGAIDWTHFDNTTPLDVNNNATQFTDGIRLLALGLQEGKQGVAYTQTHTLLINAVDVLQQVGERVYYDFKIPRDADVLTFIHVAGADAVDVCSGSRTVPLTPDVVVVHVASQYTPWHLRLWWNSRPRMNDQVTVSYQARLYVAQKRQLLATYLLRTSTHSYYSGVAEPLQQL